MVKLAEHILENKAGHFNPDKFKDQYENALKKLVRRKASAMLVTSFRSNAGVNSRPLYQLSYQGQSLK
jgi:DNA end-binding protein Ku